MKTLLLLRHAKSSWSDPDLADFYRPLNARGRRAAPAMGRFFAEACPYPDLAVCSEAVRAQETWALAAAAFDPVPETRIDPRLYHATVETLMSIIAETPTSADVLMLIGHNPGIEMLGSLLVGDPASRDARRMARKFPTAAIAEFSFQTDDWTLVGTQTGQLVRFFRPKDL